MGKKGIAAVAAGLAATGPIIINDFFVFLTGGRVRVRVFGCVYFVAL